MLSERFPILAMMTFAIIRRKKTPVPPSWLYLFVVLCIYFLLQMFFGGLRGSRSNTIWDMVWAVGIVHFWLRPVPRKMILAGLIPLVLFLYVYGFYKEHGRDVLQLIESSSARRVLIEESDRTFESVFLSDFERSDVQAFMLYRLLRPGSDYEYAWGRTYYGAVAILIPRPIWPDRPPHKEIEGTELLYGMDWYIPGVSVSARVYGIAGEAMLNFGPVGVPIAYAVFGYIVKSLRNFIYGLERFYSHLLLVPFIVNFCFIILFSDLDNMIFFSINNGAVPILVVFLISTKAHIKLPLYQSAFGIKTSCGH